MFSTACGWLWWEPETIETTSIARLELALAGKGKFLKAIFGGSDEKTQVERELELLNSPPEPQVAAQQFINFVKRNQAEANRKGKK